MIEQSLKSILESGVFAQKKVCIEESLPQNATFLVVDIASIMGLSIFAFNETTEHFTRFATQHGREVAARSIYDGEYVPSGIADDVWTARNVYGTSPECHFSVYRSNSFQKAEMYRYDVIVRVEPLESGTSAGIDGRVVAFDRQKRYFELKYKVLRDRTAYYS